MKATRVASQLFTRKSRESLFIFDDFEVKETLGSGSYATVYKCKSRSKKPIHVSIKTKNNVAIKKINKFRSSTEFLHGELDAGKRLSHPNIVKTLNYFEDSENLYLVQEYIKKSTNLFDYLEKKKFQPMEEKLARKLIRQLAEALLYARSEGVSHRDVKLENIIYCEDKQIVKIIDWGLCCVDKVYENTQFVGSPDYVAPEVLLHKEYLPELADVWSLGVVAFIILTGRIPFHRKIRSDLQSISAHPSLAVPSSISISDETFEFLNGMLTPEPSKRFSLRNVCNHKWLQDK